MKHIKMVAALMAAVLALAGSANAGMEITEWMYSGYGPEFIEFTNAGSTAIDMTGWSYDDDSRTAGTVSLSAFGVVAPGEAVVLTEGTAEQFRTVWGLSASVKVIGGNTANIGRADEINIFDAANALVDRLTYNDQAGQGPRTQCKSCNIPAAGYGQTTAQSVWVLASVGDSYGSWAAPGGDIGSPGVIPEPGSLVAVAAGLVGLIGSIRRKR